MKRLLVIGFALLEIAAPERIVEPAERLAFENPDDGRLRSWTLPMARLEGLTVLWLVLRGDRSLADLAIPAGVFGVAMALSPRSVLAFNLQLAYENAEELEVKPWAVHATRSIGILYVVLALFSARADAPTDERDAARS